MAIDYVLEIISHVNPKEVLEIVAQLMEVEPVIATSKTVPETFYLRAPQLNISASEENVVSPRLLSHWLDTIGAIPRITVNFRIISGDITAIKTVVFRSTIGLLNQIESDAAL